MNRYLVFSAALLCLPGLAAAAVCRSVVHGGVLELTEQEADPTAWERACPTLVRFLALPAPPWTDAVAQRAAQALRQLDYFRDATCAAPEVGVIHCDLQPQYMVTDSRVEGDLPLALPREDIRHRLFLRPGAVVPSLPPALRRQQARLEAYFRSEGFPDATVQVRAEADPGAALQVGVRVVVHVNTGEPLTVGAVHVLGEPPMEVDKIQKVFIHPILFNWGRLRYRRAQLDEDVVTLISTLQDQDWPAASVQVRPQRRGAVCDLEVTVHPGPRVEMRFRGNEAISDRKLRDLATFRAAGAVDALEVENTRARMLEKYQTEGYVTVDIQGQQERPDPSLVLINWTVHEGPRRPLKAVRLSGNTLFNGDDGALADAAEMLTRPSGAILKHYWVDSRVRRDVQMLQGLYNRQGYPHARVQAQRQVLHDGSLEAIFRIEPGPREIVAAVQIPGLPTDMTASAHERLSLHPGAPYDAQNVDADADVLRALLASRGYLRAKVLSYTNSISRPDVSEFTITHEVKPGPQAVRAGLMVSGNLRTRQSTLEEEMPGRDGDVLDVGAVGKAQKRLGALRIFNRVQLRPISGAGSDPNTWIFASVQEQSTRTMDAVLSFSTDDDFSLGADFRDRNLLGRALALDASVRFGNAEQFFNEHLRIGNVDRAEVKLRAPRPFGLPVDADAAALYEYTDRALYRYRTVGGTGTVTRTVLERGECAHCPTVVVRMGYQLVEAEYQQKVATAANRRPVGAPRYIPSATIGRLIPGVAADARDNVLDPHKGYFADVRLEVAHPVLAGPLAHHAVAFWRFLTSVQGYIPLLDARLARLNEQYWLGGPLVLALNSQYSAAGPWTDRGLVPTSETFAYGGDFSVRGLNNGASSVSLLAHSMVVFSAELRWTAAELWIGTLALGAFTDVGTVAPGPRSLFKETTVSFGPVLRYVTPVGPLALAYGITAVRPPSLAAVPGALPPHGRVHFSFGTSF